MLLGRCFLESSEAVAKGAEFQEFYRVESRFYGRSKLDILSISAIGNLMSGFFQSYPANNSKQSRFNLRRFFDQFEGTFTPSKLNQLVRSVDG